MSDFLYLLSGASHVKFNDAPAEEHKRVERKNGEDDGDESQAELFEDEAT